MRTPKQIEASRANGAQSRGPNHSQHLRSDLAHSVLLPGESRHRFDALHRSLESELLPETPIERLLVAKMTVAQWRQMRIWTLEKESFASGPVPDSAENAPTHLASSLLDRPRASSFLSQYEMRCDRQFSRALSHLTEWRAARGGAPAKNLPVEPGEFDENIPG